MAGALNTKRAGQTGTLPKEYDGHKYALPKVVSISKNPEIRIFAIEMLQKFELIDTKITLELAETFTLEGQKRTPSLPVLRKIASSITDPQLLTEIQGLRIHRHALEIVGERIDELSRLERGK